MLEMTKTVKSAPSRSLKSMACTALLSSVGLTLVIGLVFGIIFSARTASSTVKSDLPTTVAGISSHQRSIEETMVVDTQRTRNSKEDAANFRYP